MLKVRSGIDGKRSRADLAANTKAGRKAMIKVYGRANSINVRRVLWMLDEVGEAFEREDWGRDYRPTSDPVFQAINPIGVVPVIDDGEFRLRESNSIVRYLARKHNRTDLYPEDLRMRATIESYMDWSSTDFARGMTPVFHGLIVKNPAYVDQIESGAKEWARQMKILDEHLSARGPFVDGRRLHDCGHPRGTCRKPLVQHHF